MHIPSFLLGLALGWAGGRFIKLGEDPEEGLKEGVETGTAIGAADDEPQPEVMQSEALKRSQTGDEVAPEGAPEEMTRTGLGIPNATGERDPWAFEVDDFDQVLTLYTSRAQVRIQVMTSELSALRALADGEVESLKLGGCLGYDVYWAKDGDETKLQLFVGDTQEEWELNVTLRSDLLRDIVETSEDILRVKAENRVEESKNGQVGRQLLQVPLMVGSYHDGATAGGG